MMAAPGLERFAAAAGLYDPSAGRPLNFFRAFMADGAADRTLNYPRVCALQRLLGGSNAPGCGHAPLLPPFLRPASVLSVHAVMAGLRSHYQGSAHDA